MKIGISCGDNKYRALALIARDFFSFAMSILGYIN
jgi:hypothetical protein